MRRSQGLCASVAGNRAADEPGWEEWLGRENGIGERCRHRGAQAFGHDDDIMLDNQIVGDCLDGHFKDSPAAPPITEPSLEWRKVSRTTSKEQVSITLPCSGTRHQIQEEVQSSERRTMLENWRKRHLRRGNAAADVLAGGIERVGGHDDRGRPRSRWIETSSEDQTGKPS